jgi:hypothetical protein
MKYIFLLALTATFMTVATPSRAQVTTEDSVRAAVAALFTGMKDGDSAEIREAFADSAILQSAGIDKDGNTAIRNTAIDHFASIINHLGKGSADERIHIDIVRIDGLMAIAWAPYSLFFKGHYHHCGVDALQLIRTRKGWKVQYILDTERKDACPAGAPDAP